MHKTKKNKKYTGKIYRYTMLVFVISFLILNSFVHWQMQLQKQTKEAKATYTAETMVQRIETYLNQYQTKSVLLKQIVESDENMNMVKFETLADFIIKGNRALRGIELAKDGIVSEVYPVESNAQAIGLDILTYPARKDYAALAKKSGEYVMAGPLKLIQGGTGMLLINPVYTVGAASEKSFWGFTILVLDWDTVIEELNLDGLDDSFYHYRIWNMDIRTGKQNLLIEYGDDGLKDELLVSCDMKNDTWYVEIEPVNGWFSTTEFLVNSMICILLSLFFAVLFLQYAIHRQEEFAHHEEMMRAAKEIQEANEVKSRFLFNMSHDLRTPINAVIGFTELLERHSDDEKKVTDYVKKIQLSSNILLSIINHVLEMSRIENGKESLNEDSESVKELIRTIDAVFETTSRQKNITCEYHVDVTHEYAVFDMTKVEEIFLNIMSNAVKYTPEGGHITADVTEVCEKDHKALYRITIQDTGIGMSEEFIPHLFEPFARERTSTESKVLGTGLGMPIVKALVELMGGTVNVESKAGCGTKISVELFFEIADGKRAEECDQKQEISSTEGIENLAGRRILLAEDNPLNAEITVTLLEESGLSVDHAEDGKMCIEMLHQKEAGYYAAILMDIQMPQMDGYQAARAIRKADDAYASIPIIAMTANAFEEDRKLALESGMNDYIAKPIRMEIVLDVLKQWI